jgi:hypothetical protein
MILCRSYIVKGSILSIMNIFSSIFYLLQIIYCRNIY